MWYMLKKIKVNTTVIRDDWELTEWFGSTISCRLVHSLTICVWRSVSRASWIHDRGYLLSAMLPQFFDLFVYPLCPNKILRRSDTLDWTELFSWQLHAIGFNHKLNEKDLAKSKLAIFKAMYLTGNDPKPISYRL